MKIKTHSISHDQSKWSMKAMVVTAIALASSILSAEAGQGPMPSICNRGCWGARAPTCGISSMSTLNRAIIHHTAGVGDYDTDLTASKAVMRGVQNLHINNGWCDIAYHFLVDAGGHIFEGRSGSMSGLPRGTHDSYNNNSFGFTLLGYFHAPYNHNPNSNMRDKLYDVIAWRMPSAWSPYGSSTYNGNSVGYLDGHRKVKSTACPGDVMWPYIGDNRNGGEARNEVNCRKNGTCGSGSVKDRVEVFARGSAGNLIQKSYQNGVGWGGWIDLGGSITGRVGVTARTSSEVLVFARGSALNNLQQRSYTTTSGWGPWVGLGGTITSDPEAIARGTTGVEVFARGANGQLVQKSYNSGGWEPNWIDLGGNIAGGVSACARNANEILIFARGVPLNNLQQRSYSTSTGWGPWVGLGGTITSDPVAIARGTGVEVFARGANGQLVQKSYNNGSWGPWIDLGGSITDGPGVTARDSSEVLVFTRGSSVDNLQQKSYTVEDGWGAWVGLGGTITSSPEAFAW